MEKSYYFSIKLRGNFMKKLKIFFTANVLWDIYIFRYGVIKALIEDGHEVVAIAPNDERIDFPKDLGIAHKIGRASCRERVCQYV